MIKSIRNLEADKKCKTPEPSPWKTEMEESVKEQIRLTEAAEETLRRLKGG